MEKRVYQESPLKVAVNVVIGIVVLFLFAMFLFTYIVPTRPSTPKEQTFIVIIVGVVFGIIFLTLLICWLVIKKRSVTADSIGCEVTASRPFGQTEIQRFEWKDVAAVNLSSSSTTFKNSTQTSYKLSVSANGREIHLMDKTFLTQNLKNLVADVSAATKHLAYAWEECRPDETRPILETVAPFCKIAFGSKQRDYE